MVNLHVQRTETFDKNNEAKEMYIVFTCDPIDVFHENGIRYGMLKYLTDDFDKVMGLLYYLSRYTPNPKSVSVIFSGMPKVDISDVFDDSDSDPINNRLKNYI